MVVTLRLSHDVEMWLFEERLGRGRGMNPVRAFSGRSRLLQGQGTVNIAIRQVLARRGNRIKTAMEVT